MIIKFLCEFLIFDNVFSCWSLLIIEIESAIDIYVVVVLGIDDDINEIFDFCLELGRVYYFSYH